MLDFNILDSAPVLELKTPSTWEKNTLNKHSAHFVFFSSPFVVHSEKALVVHSKKAPLTKNKLLNVFTK